MRALLLLGLCGLLIAVVWLVSTGDPAPVPAPVAPPPRQPAGEWAGSDTCKECHPDIFARWANTAHAQTVREFNAETVEKPFDGEVFGAKEIDHKLGPGAWMACDGPGGEIQKYPVELVVGLRRIQMFLTRVDGRMQVLPVFLEVPESRWFHYTDFIFGLPPGTGVPPDSAYSWYTHHRNFSSRCGRCHMTDFEIGYDPDSGGYDSTWSERVVGCESCHGASGAHVTKWRRLEAGPDPIINTARMTVGRANEACGQCHSEAVMVQPGFRPGDDLYAFMDVAGLEDEKHLFPDGRARELVHNFLPITQSACAPIACTNCHDPHGRNGFGDLYRPLPDDTLCTQCHEEVGRRLTEHTHHKAESAGSRCIGCHMPRLVIEGGHGRVYDHTISIPSIENTRRWGLPNACRSCHLEEQPGFEYDPFERWYPDADRKNNRVALANAIGLAREGSPAAKPLLEKLLGDENPIYRAGAARYLARYDFDLRPALADPHALVRRAAIDGVAGRWPEALERLLDDESVVLRRNAAMALASKRERRPFDWIAARPELRARVKGVLQTCADLRPDDADLWGTLAELHNLDGDSAEEAACRARYRRLRPWQK